MKLFRKKYCIGIYSPLEDGETLLALLDNIEEFSKMMHISYKNASVTLNSIYRGKHDKIIYRNKLCTVEFINMLLDEEDL